MVAMLEVVVVVLLTRLVMLVLVSVVHEAMVIEVSILTVESLVETKVAKVTIVVSGLLAAKQTYCGYSMSETFTKRTNYGSAQDQNELTSYISNYKD